MYGILVYLFFLVPSTVVALTVCYLLGRNGKGLSLSKKQTQKEISVLLLDSTLHIKRLSHNSQCVHLILSVFINIGTIVLQYIFEPMRFLTSTCIKTISPHHLTTPRTCYHTTSKPQQLLHLLDQITTLKQFHQTHAHIITSGFQNNQFLLGKLVEISAIKLNENNNMNHPMLIFTHAQDRNQFTWNTILRGFSISQTPFRALSIFIQMCRESVQPETFTFAFVFKACTRSHALGFGKSVHALAMTSGHWSHLYVGNTGIYFYAGCGELRSAQKLFDEMSDRNVVTWNAVISGYVQNGMVDDGLRMFNSVWSEGIRPDDVTMISVLSACSQKEELELGKWVHAYIDKNRFGFESNVFLGTALIDMYAKCKEMDLARMVFNAMWKKDTGVWNSLIGGYVTNQHFKEALDLFQNLEVNRIDPNERTFVSTLCACASFGGLDIGRKIHSYVEERHLLLNASLGTALIDMYTKCGCIREAREVFDNMSERDIMTWTSMIRGLAAHGHAKDALDLFSLMLDTGPKPDGITFVGVLCACSHAGLVEDGLQYFETMKHRYNIIPTVEHYGCMIDLLGKSGRMDEAYEMICSMEILPNPIVWRALLSACTLHSNVKLAETAVENLFKLQSDNSGDYVLLANIYASAGRWEDADQIRGKMEEGRLKKQPGLRSIETNSKQRLETCT